MKRFGKNAPSKINYEWPVKLTDFSQDTSVESFSRGKLKVFYKGETADHRYFSEAFSNNLIQSLPYTPVVSYYDEEKQDFVGHATEQQILGIVDPCREISFETEEDGTSWCVCDVVLYTERPDKTGEIAKKIVGHKQSLELDPNTTEYVINYDEKKHFKNIEFTAGRFVGVSVLGNDQKPAFTGSSFFTCDEQFENKMKILREYCENAGKDENITKGDEKMNLKEFIKLSWGDVSLKVAEEISKQYAEDAYTDIVDMFEDSAIVRFYYFVEGVSKLMRVKYSIDENGAVSLGAVNEVHVAYEDIIENEKPEETPQFNNEIDTTTQVAMAATEKEEDDVDEEVDRDGKKQEDDDCNTSTAQIVSTEATAASAEPAESTEPEKIEKEDEQPAPNKASAANEDEPKKEEENIDKCENISTNIENASEIAIDMTNDNAEETSAPVENVQITSEQDFSSSSVIMKAEQSSDEENRDNSNDDFSNNDESSSQQEVSTASSATFTESDRAEFEALKREKKIALVNSYKDKISEEDFNSFVSKIEDFDSDESLELALLKSYKKYQEDVNSNVKPMRAFAFAPANLNNNNGNNNADYSLDSFVRKNIRK